MYRGVVKAKDESTHVHSQRLELGATTALKILPATVTLKPPNFGDTNSGFAGF
jgi:hypothetical protein